MASNYPKNIRVNGVTDLLDHWDYHTNRAMHGSNGHLYGVTDQIYAALTGAVLVRAGYLQPQLGAAQRTATADALMTEGFRLIEDDLNRARRSEKPADRSKEDGHLAVILWQIPQVIGDLHDAGLGEFAAPYVQVAQRLSEDYLVQRVTHGTRVPANIFWRTGDFDRRGDGYPQPPNPMLKIIELSDRALHMVRVADLHIGLEHRLLGEGLRMQQTHREPAASRGRFAQAIENQLRFGQLGLDQVTRAWLLSRGLDLIGDPEAAEFKASLRTAALRQVNGVSTQMHHDRIDLASKILVELGDTEGAAALSVEKASLSPTTIGFAVSSTGVIVADTRLALEAGSAMGTAYLAF